MTHRQPNKLHVLKNERGILTLDFLFASVIVFGFSAILFSFALTLSVAEVVQYISFSAARNYSLAHLSQEKQAERAQYKYDQLASNPAIRSLFNNGWFELFPAQISDFNSEYDTSVADDSDTFVGVRIPMSAPILYKRIPMLGTTGTDPDGFRANVQSFLSREPTFQDCQDFINQRATALQNASGFSFDVSSAAAMMDNGC